VSDKPSRLLLFDPEAEYEGDVVAELQRSEEIGLHERHHCSKRNPWYAIVDTKIPQLFLPYMGSLAPTLVVNDAGATCTNSIHRVNKRKGVSASISAIAAGSWTTLFALSAEIQGRSYGGGVLKLEPGGAASTVLPVGPSADVLGQVEAAFRDSGIEGARREADQHLLIDAIGLTDKDIQLLRSAERRLREQRRP
jgi:hypothetical protein